MEMNPKFLSFKGVVMAVTLLISSSSGVLLHAADTHVEGSLIVAQMERIIKGVVTDQKGEPLVGCNVVVIGTQKGYYYGY